ncbi:hypothetical protein MSKU9_0835 [Komagataeibacter diospyri]|uniref:MobA/VirD2-like nuclease domain-containing protein n=2 Tax=Komagataeibacter diospyri TaxID=1932662 RepID=A0A4P5NRB3_9PROT|nr:hypothetical protein MSKU9_0835 [Komagataeibacter diospyri]
MDARASGLKYGFHHFKISPEREISREQARQDFQAIAYEYGFDLSDAVIVEHQKQRTKKENSAIHWHMIVPHYNQKTGRALDCRNSYKRNEKLSRLSEIRTGQTIIQGRHNRAVFHALKAEGKEQEAQAIQHTTEGDLPGASFSTNQQRKAERKGISLPEEKQAITDIWSQSDGLKAFIAGLDNAGYTFQKGDKKDTFIIMKDSTLIGSANRLLKMKKGDFARLYNQYQEDLKNVQLDKERERQHGNQEGRNAQDAHTGQKEGRGYQNPSEVTQATTRPGEETRTTETPTATRGKPDIDEGENGHGTNPGLANRQQARRRTGGPDSTNSGFAGNDSRTKQTDNHLSESYIKNAVTSAKIRKRGTFKKREKFTIITPEYLQNIKDKLAKEKTGNKDFYREQYKNIKEQEYHIDTYNKSIDTSVSLLLVDMFLRLFGYSLKKDKPTPVIKKPDVSPPVSKSDFDLMTEQEKKTVTYKAYGLYRSSYETYANLCKKHDVPHDDFQGWLNDLGGDYMSEQIINLYPEIYMRELDKSANEYDRMASAELRKIWNNETSEYESQFANTDGIKTHITHLHGEIREQIKLEHENKLLDAEVAKVAAEYHGTVNAKTQSDATTGHDKGHDTGDGLRIK